MAWRLLSYESGTACDNMAIDEAILEAHLAGLVPPTLRLYAFSPAAVSLGYAQKMSEETISSIRAKGYDVVRRPTGGRAVLHANEITYSFVGTSVGTNGNAGTAGGQFDRHQGGFLSASVPIAYKQICQGLIEALRILGLKLELGGSGVSYTNMEDCFLATTGADLHYRGEKMIGSAQLRRGKAVLQHGSLLLDQDQGLMDSLLGAAAASRVKEVAHHANLFQALGKRVPIADLQDAFKAGFASAFQEELVVAPLTREELALTAQLKSKYLNFTARPQRESSGLRR